MVSLRKLHPQIRKTLEYFDKYSYPLTRAELTMWGSPITHPSVPSLKLREGKKRGELYFLAGRENLVNIRKKREKYSLLKWGIAYSQAARLAKLPFIAAIFVTGSLAMSNCKKTDDIDLMIITHANTLWITRFLVNIFFLKNRRFPGVKTAPDKICTNLWLDTNNLVVHTHSIYLAHEILQAKCIFDRGGIHHQFLKQNSWVKDYLPNAYKYLTLSPSPEFRRGKPQQGEVFWKFLNLVFFVVQYLYMKPKMTTERVGPGFAFFHPQK